MARPAYVAGVGMIPFSKPEASEPYHVMGAEAARLALADACGGSGISCGSEWAASSHVSPSM